MDNEHQILDEIKIRNDDTQNLTKFTNKFIKNDREPEQFQLQYYNSKHARNVFF